MMMTTFSLTNPNPNFVNLSLYNHHLSFSSSCSSMASFSFPSLKLESIGPCQIISFMASLSPKGLIRVSVTSSRLMKKRVSFAASPEDSPLEPEIDTEKNDLKNAGKASQEAWEQTLASFKEQALKIQSVSQDAYEIYMKKAIITLKDTAEHLKIQADQARQDLSVMAKELSEEGRQYLTTATENSPEPVKDVVDTFASSRDLDDVSKVRDFYIGIPYGTILSAGGFLNFMVTGNLSSIRFGVILGGILLALSVSSLRSWRRGESTDTILKGQAGIASILFLRDTRLVFEGLTFSGLLKMIISGAVAMFYIYRIFYKQVRQSNDGEEATS